MKKFINVKFSKNNETVLLIPTIGVSDYYSEIDVCIGFWRWCIAFEFEKVKIVAKC